MTTGLQLAISSVDVLCSFAAFGLTSSGPTCRPKLVPQDEQGAIMAFKSLWHPCAVAALGASIVPNDLTLGHRLDKDLPLISFLSQWKLSRSAYLQSLAACSLALVGLLNKLL